MAIQKSIVKIEGTVGGLTFYKSGGEYLVREKGGISGDRIATDPNFTRTRENNTEFGAAGTAGKILRDSLRVLLMNVSDKFVTARVTSLMHSIMKADENSKRGERTPYLGLQTLPGMNLIKGFNFNQNAVLGSILYKSYSVDKGTGVISIPSLNPSLDIAFPTGATHVTITGAKAAIDLNTGESDVQLSNKVNIALGNSTTSVVLTPTQDVTGNGNYFFLLKVEFFQMVNGDQYPMRNGAYNSLAIIDID